MATVAIDFIAKGQTEDEWLIVLVEAGPWCPPYEEELRRLQDRLYGCIKAALDGQLAEKFPQTRGRRVRIRLDGYNLPREETLAFFDRFSTGALRLPDYVQALARSENVSGVDFEINLDQIH
jgi:hypothetical protein